MIEHDQLEQLLSAHLPRQRWFAGADAAPVSVEVLSATAIRDGWPGLVHVIVAVAPVGAVDASRYQLLIGLRPPQEIEVFLEGKVEAYLGDVTTSHGPAHAYDAVYDLSLIHI